jgi:hypothetical protein
MGWEERLLDLFDDLEQQAEGLALADRDAEVAERSRAEYAQVDLASRLHASVGRTLVIGVAGVGQLDATVLRAGRGWCLVRARDHEWVLRLASFTYLRGLSVRAVAEPARPVTARLGLGSVLRGLAGEGTVVVVHRLDGSLGRGRLLRVGGDFLELAVEDSVLAGGREAWVEVVPFGQVAAIRQT